MWVGECSHESTRAHPLHPILETQGWGSTGTGQGEGNSSSAPLDGSLNLAGKLPPASLTCIEGDSGGPAAGRMFAQPSNDLAGHKRGKAASGRAQIEIARREERWDKR